MKLINNFLSSYDIAYLLNLSETMSGWTKGRQGTGYDVLYLKDRVGIQYLISSTLTKLGPIFEDFWDAYLIRYQVGDFIDYHKDEAAFFGKRHHRINAMVKVAEQGGDFFINHEKVEFPLGAAIDFFPDEEEHGVTKVEKGLRLVFSVGCWQ